MQISSDAIILTIRPHGEHGAIVRAITPEHGLLAGYVRGARSRHMRPIVMPANVVTGHWRARLEGQLPGLQLELKEARSPFYREPLIACSFEWATMLTALILPEGDPCPDNYQALSALLALICAAPAARHWAEKLAHYEAMMLDNMGQGMALSRCALGGKGALIGVSPRSGRAVSEERVGQWRDKLLPLPEFMQDIEGAPEPDMEAILSGLSLTGHFLIRALDDHGTRMSANILPIRARLITQLEKML